MSLADFVKLFGYFADPKTGERAKFEAWPKQVEFMDWLDAIEDSGIVLKSRQAGFSTMAGFAAIKECFSYSNCVVPVISKDSEAAEEFLKARVKRALEMLPSIEGLQWPKVVKANLDEIEFGNGSRVKVVSSTSTSAAGYTGRFVIMDEAALMDANNASGGAGEIFATTRPVVQKAGGRILLMSTIRPGSWFRDVVEGIHAGEKSMPMFFFPASADPTLTPEVVAQLRMEYPSDVEFKREYPMCVEDALSSNSGLVYKNFQVARHTGERSWPDDDCRHFVAMDHGYRHNTAVIWAKYNKYEDHLHVYKEFIINETQVEDIAKIIKPWLSRMPSNTRFIGDAAIFAKTGQRGSIADIYKEFGIFWLPSYKYKGLDSVDGSLAKLGTLFTWDKITISPECPRLIWEIRNWRWNDKGNADKPVDKDDDAIDALRYIAAELSIDRKIPSGGQKMLPYSYRKMAAYRNLAKSRGQASTDGQNAWMAT